jgi:tRNA pseudouridine38-40 synthase
MKRLKLTISYDGAHWQGWQSQPSGKSVQDRLEAALCLITKNEVRVHGSGRTDTGVHAFEQTAHCDVPAALAMEPENWVRALNTHLPRSIRVMRCEFAEPEFHARYSAKGKVYRYRIFRGDVLGPFDDGRASHVYGELDLNALRACASALIGTHNFARLSAFRNDAKEAVTRGDPAATTRTIHRVVVHGNGDELTIEFEGEGFLYKMVRMMTGAMIHVARGNATVAWFEALLAQPDGLKNHHCAPADGLYLVRVLY